MSFKSFLISKVFFKHLVLAFIAVVVLIFITIKALDIYTNHGDFILVPDLESRNADSLIMLSDEDYLRYEIFDSVYNDDLYPGVVVLQNPKQGSKVKAGRKIYLSIVARSPEMVKMPNLIDLTVRRAVDILHYSHLKVEKLEFTDDIALNAVLMQYITGDTIHADSLIPSRSAISLLVGNGYIKEGITVPFLIGKTIEESQNIILKSSFNVGNVDTLVENFDSDWLVYAQTPKTDPLHPSKYDIGGKIDLKVRSELGYNFDSVLHYYNLPDSLRIDNLLVDSLFFEFN